MASTRAYFSLPLALLIDITMELVKYDLMLTINKYMIDHKYPQFIMGLLVQAKNGGFFFIFPLFPTFSLQVPYGFPSDSQYVP
jgi:hypothetical protein